MKTHITKKEQEVMRNALRKSVEKTHLIQNMIIQDDRREYQAQSWGVENGEWETVVSQDKRRHPHNYSSSKSLIWIPVEPEPKGHVQLCMNASGKFFADDFQNDLVYFDPPFSPNDLLVEPEEWVIQQNNVATFHNIYDDKRASHKEPNALKQPPSTMPLSLASKCSKKYKVEQVVGVEEIDTEITDVIQLQHREIQNPPKKWHWLIIGEKI